MIHTKLHVPDAVSLALVIVSLGAVFAGAAWLLIPAISQQVETLSQEIPKAWAQLRSQLEQMSWMKHLLASILARARGVKPRLPRSRRFFPVGEPSLALLFS